MKMHRIQAWLAGCIFLSSCLLVYKMTSTVPQPSTVTLQKVHSIVQNGSFMHPHIIMRTSKGHSNVVQQGELLEEVDGHIPENVNTKIKKIIPHISELQKETSERVTGINNTLITMRLFQTRQNHSPSLNFPACPPTFTPNTDQPELEILRKCSKSSLSFPPELELWLYKDESMCEGRLHIFDAQAVLLRDVVIDRSVWDCKENNDDNTDIEGKRCVTQRGGFIIFCDFNDHPVKFFKGSVKNHLQNWLAYAVVERGKTIDVNELEEKLTIAVQRHDHRNLYNTMAEIYNAFIVMRFCGEHPDNIKVLFIDPYTKGLSESVWSAIFPNTDHIQKLPPLTFYQRMFWSPFGQLSPFVMHNEKSLAYIEEFREFVLGQFGVPVASRLDCKRLRITLTSFHDYNSGGSKKDYRIRQNEMEILKAIKQIHQSFIVEKVLMEKYDIKDQLELAANTDVLIGVHGASLTHALFLPSHGGVIEFVPSFGLRHNSHYEALARWRHLAYVRWENRDVTNDSPDQVTVVPPFIVKDRMRKIYAKLCPTVKLK